MLAAPAALLGLFGGGSGSSDAAFLAMGMPHPVSGAVETGKDCLVLCCRPSLRCSQARMRRVLCCERSRGQTLAAHSRRFLHCPSHKKQAELSPRFRPLLDTISKLADPGLLSSSPTSNNTTGGGPDHEAAAPQHDVNPLEEPAPVSGSPRQGPMVAVRFIRFSRGRVRADLCTGSSLSTSQGGDRSSRGSARARFVFAPVAPGAAPGHLRPRHPLSSALCLDHMHVMG